MQQSIVKLIALSYRPRLRTLPPPHSHGNQRLRRQFDWLLMMKHAPWLSLVDVWACATDLASSSRLIFRVLGCNPRELAVPPTAVRSQLQGAPSDRKNVIVSGHITKNCRHVLAHGYSTTDLLTYTFLELTGTRQAVKVQRNIEARSNTHCSCGEAKRVVYSECVSVAFVIQDAKRMRHIM
jgi:hypothetical protein